MAAHSSTLAWKTPWTKEPGRLLGVTKSRTRLSDFTFFSFFLFVVVSCKKTPLKNKTVIFIDTFKDWWRNTQKPVSWKTNKTFLQSKKVHSWVGGADNWQEDWSRGIWRKRGGGREGRREKEKLPFTISGCKGKFMYSRGEINAEEIGNAAVSEVKWSRSVVSDS